jgi:hypothetical protein
MRPDQLIRIAELSEKLAEVVLEEADPETWPGAGVPLAEMSNEQRGNRYWAKKNAAATFTLLDRTASLLQHISDPSKPQDNDEDLDKQLAAREKEAAKMLDRVMKGAKAVSRGKA